MGVSDEIVVVRIQVLRRLVIVSVVCAMKGKHGHLHNLTSTHLASICFVAMDSSSELTDIESDDYEATVKKRGRKASKKDHKGWRLKNVLKVPRATTYTAQALYGESDVLLPVMGVLVSED